jgi:hypothetical protein
MSAKLVEDPQTPKQQDCATPPPGITKAHGERALAVATTGCAADYLRDPA